MSHQLARRWFTASEYNRMAEAGILTEDDRVELIEGEIVEMSPIGSRHAACVNRLNMLLSRQAGQLSIVSVQNPIVVGDYSEPEPDVAVLRMRDDYYSRELPTASDVLILIEVADTSVDTDRSVKIPLYARAGVHVTMLVDLSRDLIEIHSEPANGQYQSVQLFMRGDSFQLDVVPQLNLSVDAILG
jgi:Uma2 family endonuclease